MMLPSLGLVLAAAIGLAESRSLFNVPPPHARLYHKRQNQASNLQLAANALQTGSEKDGSVNGVLAAGQSASQTSKENFINFCSGKTLTNGLQVIDGSCNGIPMGDIPSKQNMVSSIITFPAAGSTNVKENITFNIQVQMINFVAGSFTSAQKTYYSAPQTLSGGKIVGHTHVTVQDMGADLNPTQALDATKFVFFKGINDAGNGNGLLSATVTGGLPAGNYRICTLASSSNHQLVLMPVAQRGAQDDCTKFTVTPANGNGNNGGNGNGNNGGNGNGNNGGNGNGNNGGNGNGNNGGNGNGNNGGNGNGNNGGNGNGNNGGNGNTNAGSESTTSALSTSISIAAASTTTTSQVSVKPPFLNGTIAATTTRRRGGGKGNGGRPTKNTIKNVLTSTTSVKATSVKATTVKATSAAQPNKGVSSSVTTTRAAGGGNVSPPASTTKAGTGNNGGKGNGGNGNGGKGNGGKKNNGGSKGVKNNEPHKTVIVTIVHKITVIRTIFTFSKSCLGGSPPSVSKSGSSFIVLEEIFDSVSAACNAACGHQYTRCISFSGPGFEIEKCETQKQECGAAAEVVKSTATEKEVTATVTVPPTASASLPGSIIGEETVSSTVEVVESTSTQAGIEKPAATGVTPEAIPSNAAETSPPKPTGGAANPVEAQPSCVLTRTVTVEVPAPTLATPSCILTSTVTVDAPAATLVAKPFSNSTISSASLAPVATPTASAAASAGAGAPVAGIAAPAVEASGDAKRPFLVNGNTFVNEAAAVQRSCDIQFNKCADAVNGGKAIGVSFSECTKQKDECGK